MKLEDQVSREFRSNPAGPRKIHARLQARGVKATLDEVRDIMLGPRKKNGNRDARKGFKTYLDFEPAPTKRYHPGSLFGRSGAELHPAVTNEVGDLVEVDLIDGSKSKIRFGERSVPFVMLAVDTFSRYAWGFPLQSKTTAALRAAFEKLFEEVKPDTLITDQEAGILALRPWFRDLEIEWVNKNHAAPHVESLIRTLRRKAGFMGAIEDKNVPLDRVIEKYNEEIHSATRLAPEDVLTDRSAQVLAMVRGLIRRDKLHEKANSYLSKFDVEVGAKVRTPKNNQNFIKTGRYQWRDNELTVEKRQGNTVLLEDGKHYFPWQVRAAGGVEVVNRVQPARRAQPARRRAQAAPALALIEAPRPKREVKRKEIVEDLEGVNPETGRKSQAREKRGDYGYRPSMQEVLAALKPKPRPRRET